MVRVKVNRDVLQAKANRGSPQIVTPVEMDFVYPPTCDIVSVSRFAIEADTLWLELRRCACHQEGADNRGPSYQAAEVLSQDWSNIGEQRRHTSSPA